MGAHLVAAAWVYVCPVLGRNHAARSVLLAMANTALDRDNPPLYFGGWQPLAHGLGLSGTDDSQRDRITKVIRQLEDAGAVRLYDDQQRGRPTTYELMLIGRAPLTLVRDPVDNDADHDSRPGRNSRVDPAVTAGRSGRNGRVPYKDEETGGAMEESLLRQPPTAAAALGLWTAP